MNRGGATSQPLRSLNGGVYQNQAQASAARNGTLGSGRLQNSSKLGNNSGWGGFGMAGAPGMQNPQARTGSAGFGSFAQTLGGSANQGSLDLSEFPSLGGGQQPQHSSNPSQAIWGNSNGRGDEFPPLGGLGAAADLSQTRRVPSAQGAPYKGMAAPGAQGRDGVLGQLDSGADGPLGMDQNISPSTIGSGGVALGRVLEAKQRADLGAQGHGGQIPLRPGSGANHQQRLNQGQRHVSEQSQGAASESARGEVAAESQLSETERYGFPGFLEKISGSSDQTGLAWGIDLNSLGLDLNRMDSPLYRDFPGPFAESGTRTVIPDFTLPPAYTVQNVPPLESKIGSFSDETLFAIFYQSPRDVAQDLAAQELYARDWRWHKKLRQWMMKAKEFGEPTLLPSMKEERGFYYFFDAPNWRRERKEFILNYEHLYHGQPVTQTQ